MGDWLPVILMGLAVFQLIWTLMREALRRRRKRRPPRIKASRPMTVDAFLSHREAYLKRHPANKRKRVPGVYILHNRTTGHYYVGQASHLYDRTHKHFTGRGNGDVYADYKHGHDWRVTLVKLDDTSFDTLNDLERHYITKHDAYYNGYNKTRGNR